MDTEVYSNTGGQASKATPLGAAAKFAASGKPVGKKDLGLLANMYGHVYVARVAFGAKMAQTAQAFVEAESYDGPSLIIAYSHCIAHGYDMAQGASQQKLAVESGVWPLYRFDPRRIPQGEAPLHLDYGPPKAKVADYLRNESRFRMVERADPARYKMFVAGVAGGRRTPLRRLPATLGHEGSGVRGHRAGRGAGERARRPRRSDGSQHDVSRASACPIRWSSAPDRSATISTRSRRSKTPARRCWCCARCTKRKSSPNRWTPSSTSTATCDSFSEASSFESESEHVAGAGRVPRASAPGQAHGRHPGDRVAQRRHARAAGRLTRS